MKRKHWGIIAAAGFGGMLLVYVLMVLGAPMPRRLMQVLVLACTAVFLIGLLGGIAHGTPYVCPHCGKGIYPRGFRAVGGRRRAGGLETAHCPHCGAMVHPYDVRTKE